jgi:N-acetyl-anhydromuramyl-L-alanine amidase AmpD
MTTAPMNAVLPKLASQWSPNQSDRNLQVGEKPYLIVVHRPVGAYHGSADWLCNPRAQASAHILTEGNGTGVDEATQLVPWDRKAWHASAFNSISYGIEVDDNAWDGSDPGAFETAARIVAFLCMKTNIPPVWSRDPLHKAGIVRHYDLGRAGGSHTDPTLNPNLWAEFIVQVREELARGGFRKTWGRGKLAKII